MITLVQAPDQPDAPLEGPDGDVEFLRASVMEVITIHTAMFEKLLFQGKDLPLDLAELFEDIANTYLTFSESISRLHLTRELDVQCGADTSVVLAR